jgi:hypothetical protein
MSDTPVTVIHLVRAANGPDPFEAFLDAFRAHPPGVDCELVLAMKGFEGPAAAESYLARAGEFRHTAVYFDDEGLDLAVYMAAAMQLARDRYCFVNSFSLPLVDGWLAKLDEAFASPDVGIAGATGSWASPASRMAHLMFLPSAYRGALPKRKETLEQFMALDVDQRGIDMPAPDRPTTRKLAEKWSALSEIPTQTLGYERFPAYHVRTNAFLIGHATLASLRWKDVRRKQDAYDLEHGRRSITRQVQRMGLRTVLVDRHGAAFDRDEWHRARVFWQGDQEGLLVADNQTRCYERASLERRRLLSAYAWGRFADPTAPPGGALQAGQTAAGERAR